MDEAKVSTRLTILGRQEMWWQAYLAALTGLFADSEMMIDRAYENAEAAADHAVKTFEKRFCDGETR